MMTQRYHAAHAESCALQQAPAGLADCQAASVSPGIADPPKALSTMDRCSLALDSPGRPAPPRMPLCCAAWASATNNYLPRYALPMQVGSSCL